MAGILLDLLRLTPILAGPLPFALDVAARTRPPTSERSGHTLLVTLVVWTSCQATVGLVVGSLGRFDLGGVLVAECLLLVCGVLASRQYPARPDAPLRRQLPAAGPWHGLVGAALTGLALSCLFWSLRRAILDYDSLGYHLPPVARWIQTGSIFPLDHLAYRYPFTWEVVAGLFVLPFSDDLLVTFPSWIAWVIFGVAIYRVALDLGARTDAALASALLVCGMSEVHLQVATVHVDPPMAAFFMAGLHFALSVARGGLGSMEGMLLLVSAAMMVGVKTSGLLYAALLWPLALATIRARSPDTAGRVLGIDARAPRLALLAAAAVVGGFWYAAWLLRGDNPLGDLEIRLGGITLLTGRKPAGHISRTTLLYLFHLSDPANWSIALAAAWRALGLPMVFLLATILAFGWRLRRWHGAPIWQVCALCLLAVATTLAYAATPYSASNPSHDYRLTPWMQQAIRYAFPLVGLVGVLGAVAIDCARESRPILVATGMTLAIAEVWDRGAPGTVAAAMTVWAAWMAGGLVDRSSWRLAGRTMVVAAALLAVGITTSRAWGKRRADRLKQYGGVQDFIAQTIGTEEIVGYAFSSRPYVLYGVALRQQVANVTPSAGGSLDDWLEELRREGISLLAVGPLPRRHRMRPEVQWTLRADGPFERVHGERPAREVVLYRLRRP